MADVNNVVCEYTVPPPCVSNIQLVQYHFVPERLTISFKLNGESPDDVEELVERVLEGREFKQKRFVLLFASRGPF